MKAVQTKVPGTATVVTDAPVPKLRPTYVLVKVHAVALNPTDWKHIDGVQKPGVIVGCDYAGTVESVGPAAGKAWKQGDRIAGFVHGANVVNGDGGAFGEYLVAKADLQVRIPEGMGFEAAAGLGVGIATVAQGLYQSLGLPLPGAGVKEGTSPVLIYGGSSAMGAYGIQWAKLSGLEVITTCSSSNFDYVKSLGADAVFDYNSPTVGADIRAHTHNKLYYAWDTIGTKTTAQICADALSSESAMPSGMKLQYSAILSVKCPRDEVESQSTLAYTIIGEPFSGRGIQFPAKPEDYAFGKMFVPVAERMLQEGKLKPHQFEVRPGGLDGVLDGLKDMKEGKISAKKIVYKLI